MATLTGLGPLRHFNLDFLRAAQVLPRYAEASGGYLLDSGTAFPFQTFPGFAALAGI